MKPAGVPCQIRVPCGGASSGVVHAIEGLDEACIRVLAEGAGGRQGDGVGQSFGRARRIAERVQPQSPQLEGGEARAWIASIAARPPIALV